MKTQGYINILDQIISRFASVNNDSANSQLLVPNRSGIELTLARKREFCYS
jgi:hypothetical protein